MPIYVAPQSCGGKCVFCPKAQDFPSSYIRNSDTLFAHEVGFSASLQLHRFLSQIPQNPQSQGVPLEIIVLGGSFSALSVEYRLRFTRDLYEAMIGHSCHDRRDLEESLYRCSILTVESRPDQITQRECDFLRYLGVSKVEIGAQHFKNDILEQCSRGHDCDAIRSATRLLKRNGFKVGYHVMLGLPGSTYDDDLRMLTVDLWTPEFSPDFLKVYPCVLLRDLSYQPALHSLYKSGKWAPPSREYLASLLERLFNAIPPYVRVSRIQRQFPLGALLGGYVGSLRNETETSCKCVRCREAGKVCPDRPLDEMGHVYLRKTKVGLDKHFELLTQNDMLVALARTYESTSSISLLREIHVYGKARALGTPGQVQGRGLGEFLLKMIENDVHKCGQDTLRIHAAFGVKGFFRRHGYTEDESGFLSKHVNERNTATLSRDSASYEIAAISAETSSGSYALTQ